MKKTGLVFLILLVAAIVSDVTTKEVLKDGYVLRETLGGEEKEIQLQLNVEGILEDYLYSLEVPSVLPTKEEADKYFQKVINKIQDDFLEIGDVIPLQTEYENGIVAADWSFQPYGIISSEGEISVEKLQEEETIIQAQVELVCGEYEKIHMFSFVLKKPELSQKETVLLQIDDWIKKEAEKEGDSKILLPKEFGGVSLEWTQKQAYVTPKIVLLEIVAGVLLWIMSKKERTEKEKKKIALMEKEYPDIVSSLSLLLRAGMTTRQAWSRIAEQYRFKRNAKMMEEKEVYEAILRMNRLFMEGESERAVYQQFLNEVSAPCYRKLMRILLGNLEKGAQEIHRRLQEESRLAFETRIVQAKKSGEEASTKMLVPLMLMLMVVMGMVMFPALISFQF